MRAAWLGLLAVFASPAQASPDCPPEGPLDYVCGLQKPEDVLALPGTNWLIASGFMPGAGLKLVDTGTRSFRPWYAGTPDQRAQDPRRFPHCPGPLDPALFNARGLSLREIAPQRWRLLVVNHGGRESVEVFEIDIGRAEPALRWKGCLPMPAGQVGNSVASFSDGTILVTVLTRPGTSIADFVQGGVTGGVWQWRPGDTAFALLPGTELPGNNGLETDPDGQRFYVVAFGWHAVAVFDRRDTAKPLEVFIAPDFMPDNIHWSGGRLLLAGMRYDEPACGGLRRVIDGRADPMLCHRGWIVGELDLVRHRIATVAHGGPEPGFNGISAAAQIGEMLWLGSFQSDRLAVVREPEPKRPRGGDRCALALGCYRLRRHLADERTFFHKLVHAGASHLGERESGHNMFSCPAESELSERRLEIHERMERERQQLADSRTAALGMPAPKAAAQRPIS